MRIGILNIIIKSGNFTKLREYKMISEVLLKKFRLMSKGGVVDA